MRERKKDRKREEKRKKTIPSKMYKSREMRRDLKRTIENALIPTLICLRLNFEEREVGRGRVSCRRDKEETNGKEKQIRREREKTNQSASIVATNTNDNRSLSSLFFMVVVF